MKIDIEVVKKTEVELENGFYFVKRYQEYASAVLIGDKGVLSIRQYLSGDIHVSKIKDQKVKDELVKLYWDLRDDELSKRRANLKDDEIKRLEKIARFMGDVYGI